MIKLDTILKISKTFTAKSETDDSGAPTMIARIKFSELTIDRDVIDELVGEPIGWCRAALYDEQGAPRRRYGITVYGRNWRVSGGISGPKGQPTMPLLQAELTDLQLTLVPLGALAEGTLTWAARGDEVSELETLLGDTCAAHWEVTDSGQGDLFDPKSREATAAAKATESILAGLGKRQPGAAQ